MADAAGTNDDVLLDIDLDNDVISGDVASDDDILGDVENITSATIVNLDVLHVASTSHETAETENNEMILNDNSQGDTSMELEDVDNDGAAPSTSELDSDDEEKEVFFQVRETKTHENTDSTTVVQMEGNVEIMDTPTVPENVLRKGSDSDTDSAKAAKAKKCFSALRDTNIKSINLAPLANLKLNLRARSASPMSLPSPYLSEADGNSSSTSLRDARTDLKRRTRRRRRRLGQYEAGIVPKCRLRAIAKQKILRRARSLGSFDFELSDLNEVAEKVDSAKVPVDTRGPAQLVNVVFNAISADDENNGSKVTERYTIAPRSFAMKSISPLKPSIAGFPSEKILQLIAPENVGALGSKETVAGRTETVSKGPVKQRTYRLIYPSTTQAQALLQASGLARPMDSIVTSSKRSVTGKVASNDSPMVTETIKSAVIENEKARKVPQEKELNIPLCCCRMGGTVFSNLTKVSFCQALDSVDGKPVGCCNPVTSSARCRPATRIPFMTLCDIHKQRLKQHQCCPSCGQFCTQGIFYKCQESASILHYFHKTCQIYPPNSQYSRAHCPHCGEVSEQVEFELALGPKKENDKPKDGSTGSQRARMSQINRQPVKTEMSELPAPLTPVQTLRAGDAVISSEGIPFGPQRSQLEHLLVMIDYHKPKKIRSTQKSLYNQACAGDLERVLHLIGEGFDVNYRYPDTNNQTALHAAAMNGHYLMCHVLIQAGANVNEVDNDLVTPLMKAAEKNRLDIMKLLVIAGAHVSAKGEDGMSTLHIAAKDGHFEAVKYLLETGKTDVNIVDEGGWTPLIWAAEHRRLNIVRYLLDHGADCNMKDNEENIALHWAAFSGSVDIAELFLDNFSDLESANEHGDRPLHIAARQDHYECVVLFLARGADADCRNNEGQTPVECCRNEDSPVWMALRVNKQLRQISTKRLERIPRLVHRDISFGKERNPIPVLNAVDDSRWPDDFLYVMENIETSPLNINRVITSLSSCSCLDDCGSNTCMCSRNSLRCWYDKEGRLMEDFNRLEPPLLFECNRQCRCWSTCNNRVVQNGITCRLQLFRTEGRGWGLKTLLDIPQGTFICEYIGEMISDMEADRREDDSYLFDLDNKEGDTYCIDARRYGNIARFINHLCEPNIIPVKLFVDHQDLRFPRICFFSSRLIKSGEELGFDYSEKFWIIKWKQFTCECGSPKCRYSKEVIHKTLAEYHARMEEEYALLEEPQK